MRVPLLIEACRRQPVKRTPAWFMRQAGRFLPEYRKLRERYGMLELCRNPELACQVTLMPLKRFELDAAIIFADILLVAPPMGIPFDFAKGEGPVISKPLQSRTDVNRLKIFDPHEDLAYVLKAMRLVRKELKGGTALIGFAGAPFTVASYLIEGGRSRDFHKTKQFMMTEPEAWNQLMSKLTEVTARYLLAQIGSGAQVVQIFDSWVGALSPEQFRKNVFPYSKKLVRTVKKTGAPVIYFGTQTAKFLNLFAQTGADVISVDWRINLRDAWNRIGYRKAIQGNLDPAVLLGPASQVRRETRRILEEAGGRPGHIFNLGHGILPDTPLANVSVVLETIGRHFA